MDPVPASFEQSLWSRARAGDARARETIATHAGQIAARELRARRAPPGEIDDLVQESIRSTLAFLSGGGDEPRELRAFLKFRAWGVLSDQRKRTRRTPMPTSTEETLDRPTLAPGPATVASDLQVKDALADCRALLPKEQRILVNLRYDEHLETDEIVERTRMNRNTIHVRIFRAMRGLRECLGRKGFDAGDLSS